ncbi:RNA-directed DNA polymerase, eukaryota, reverse transcriptase zinc-binding domain protein [Tanacetum coccineum]
MEVLSLLINKKIEESDNFKFHWRFSKVKLTHLCFADDLMIFSHGDPSYVDVIKSVLEDFSRCSGLKHNLEKSLVFFGNVPVHSKAAILEILPFPVSTLPIKYLGVPLISTRLYKHHCAPLINKVRMRMSNWKNKTFSFAGRLQLIKSVVSSLQVYWSSVFILPKFVSNEIEKLMRGFLWTHGDSVKGKAKVKWKDRLADKNIGERSFWDILILNDVCWGWRKILMYRDSIRKHVIRIGNGRNTYVCFDSWSSIGPLCQYNSKKDIFEAGLSLSCKIDDIVINGE